MLSAALITEARLRADLTQSELGERLGRSQSQIARWESGKAKPSLETLVAVARACGLDLYPRLYAYDESNVDFTWELLDMSLADRLSHQVAAANGIAPMARQAEAQRRRIAYVPAAPFDPVGVLRALTAARLRFVLVGRLAGNLRASALVPSECEVVVCVAGGADSARALRTALRNVDAVRWDAGAPHSLAITPTFRSHPDTERWLIASLGANLVAVESLRGTRGYEDLSRRATAEVIADGLTVDVASLVDLLRIADAAFNGVEEGELPSLRLAHELASRYVPPQERPVRIPEGLEDLYAAHGIHA